MPYCYHLLKVLKMEIRMPDKILAITKDLCRSSSATTCVIPYNRRSTSPRQGVLFKSHDEFYCTMRMLVYVVAYRLVEFVYKQFYH